MHARIGSRPRFRSPRLGEASGPGRGAGRRWSHGIHDEHTSIKNRGKGGTELPTSGVEPRLRSELVPLAGELAHASDRQIRLRRKLLARIL